MAAAPLRCTSWGLWSAAANGLQDMPVGAAVDPGVHEKGAPANSRQLIMKLLGGRRCRGLDPHGAGYRREVGVTVCHRSRVCPRGLLELDEGQCRVVEDDDGDVEIQ